MRLVLFVLFSIILHGHFIASVDSTWKQLPSVNISGFTDIYYVYDFNKPASTSGQPFLYNHNRHNEFNLNLGYVKLSLNHVKYRSNFALHTGTYVIDNYANERDLLKNIFEANIGLSLNHKNNLWLDVGIMPSHIGFESAISIDNLTMTRSLLAENSPYFMSGAKITFQPNKKIELSGLVLNGWQRIQRQNGNSMLSFGSQFRWMPSEKFQFNWSTFIGTTDPDTTRRMRYFNNFYLQYQFPKILTIIGGFDVGVQQKSKNSSTYDVWFSPVIIAQFKLTENWKTAVRFEYFDDQKGVIISNSLNGSFQTTGISLNLDYAPTKNIMLRLEARTLNSKNAIFQAPTNLVNQNLIIGASLAIKFAEELKK